MKKLNALSITVLLTFLALSVIHISHETYHSHPESNKAILNLEEWNVNSQWDDKEKHFFILHNLVVLTFLLPLGLIHLRSLSRTFERKRIFLLPIFHQSNYVILTPKL
jgi:hypothetical protein